MKKILFLIGLVLFISITPAWPALPGPYTDTPLATPHNTLRVTVSGSGDVVSTPPGIDCVNMSFGQVTCTYDFEAGSAVSLEAIPIHGLNYTSYFNQWTGDCSGSEGICALTLESDKTVTAKFVALDIPVYVLPLPTAGNIYTYPPVEIPVEQPSKLQCQPFAVGNISGGLLNLQVGLQGYNGPIDIYLAIVAPAISPEVFIFTPGNGIQALSAGAVAWKSGVSGAVNESLFGDLWTSILPPGNYYLYLMVTPAGRQDAYDLWTTNFSL